MADGLLDGVVFGVAQVKVTLLSGEVTAKVTPALGWLAPDTPVTVAVSVITELRAGLADGVKVISGVCLARRTATGDDEARA